MINFVGSSDGHGCICQSSRWTSNTKLLAYDRCVVAITSTVAWDCVTQVTTALNAKIFGIPNERIIDEMRVVCLCAIAIYLLQ